MEYEAYKFQEKIWFAESRFCYGKCLLKLNDLLNWDFYLDYQSMNVQTMHKCSLTFVRCIR